MKEQALPGTTGNNRPDLTIVSPDDSTVTIVEVSCPFEGSPSALEEAAKAKVDKYEPLRLQLLQQYANVTILPFIVGSLGSWYPGNDQVLSSLRIGHRYASLMRRLCVVSAVAGSQNIWYQAICRSHHRPPAPEDQTNSNTITVIPDNLPNPTTPLVEIRNPTALNGTATTTSNGYPALSYLS